MSAVAQLHEVNVRAHRLALHRTLRVVDGGAAIRRACELCALSATCVPEGLSDEERQAFTALTLPHHRLRAGETLFHAGEPFTYLYVVKTGALKTVVLLEDGREQVTGFHFAGDVLGIDAISSPNYPSEAVALADTQVCAIPFAQLTRLSRRVEPLQTYVQRLLAREVVRDQGLMLLLGRMHADERVAEFLKNMSKRFRARGYSPHEFTLPMAREEIGNYLGLTLETVSRCFSRLRNSGVIAVDNRRIRIRSLDALHHASGNRVSVV
jgi:CRP/FNR family transcriptional regulator, anaerobic regulatory protein